MQLFLSAESSFSTLRVLFALKRRRWYRMVYMVVEEYPGTARLGQQVIEALE